MKLFARFLLALALVFAQAANAQLLSTKVGPGGFGGGAVLSADLGVIIQPDVNISRTTSWGMGADTQQLTYSFWVNGTLDTQNGSWGLRSGVYIETDPNTHCEIVGTSGGPSPGFCITADSGGLEFSSNNSVGTNDTTDSIKFNSPLSKNLFTNGAWNHFLVSMDTSAGVAAVYVNGVNQTAAGGFTTVDLHNTAPYVNGGSTPQGFYFGNVGAVSGKGSSYTWSSDVRISRESIVCTGAGTPSTMNGKSVTCSGANVIPPEMLAGFGTSVYGGWKPVSLGSDCSSATGRQPEICLIGNGSAMATNVGTAPNSLAPAVEGTLALDPGTVKVFTAPYGPAGMIAHQATMKWVSKGVGFANVASPIVANNASYPIAVGELLIMAWNGTDTANVAARGVTCPSGWTLLQATYDTTEHNDAWLCYHIADATDAAASSFSASFTGGNYTNRGNWIMADYAQVSAVDVTGAVTNATSVSLTSKSGLTAAQSNETLVNIFFNQSANNHTYAPPGTGQTRVRETNGQSKPQVMLVDEYGLAAGSVPQRTVTRNSTDTSQVLTLTLVPN